MLKIPLFPFSVLQNFDQRLLNIHFKEIWKKTQLSFLFHLTFWVTIWLIFNKWFLGYRSEKIAFVKAQSRPSPHNKNVTILFIPHWKTGAMFSYYIHVQRSEVSPSENLFLHQVIAEVENPLILILAATVIHLEIKHFLCCLVFFKVLMRAFNVKFVSCGHRFPSSVKTSTPFPWTIIPRICTYSWRLPATFLGGAGKWGTLVLFWSMPWKRKKNVQWIEICDKTQAYTMFPEKSLSRNNTKRVWGLKFSRTFIFSISSSCNTIHRQADQSGKRRCDIFLVLCHKRQLHYINLL